MSWCSPGLKTLDRIGKDFFDSKVRKNVQVVLQRALSVVWLSLGSMTASVEVRVESYVPLIVNLSC